GTRHGIRVANDAVAISDATHVFTRLAVGWDLVAILHHRAFAGVVARECETYVTRKQIEQESHVTGAAFDVLLRVPDVRNAKATRRAWHELHQATRAFVG